MGKEECGRCKFYYVVNQVHDSSGEIVFSQCRRFPPKRNSNEYPDNDEFMNFEQPLTASDNWCGEFKPR